ncbi:hypothetical protein KC363_g8256 [Hortaea werneckii]|uniref:Uncharacterized protein n=1 Tax=Hortaea werneckii TaxID=91943 RepID=A0A3M7FDZ9_HORWE|nr:hypothetical protein KC361_g6879 [Hortaea werneckii]KAI7183407.1 hypothetical protein KC363_g8256 [Hortaea werneckii]RMY87073.1 hypothetical protein D0861_05559 [Hortaea werneckii]
MGDLEPTNSGRTLGDHFGFHKDDEKPTEGVVHHTNGPHASDMANKLDPHVPGEFPTESGEDPHGSSLDRNTGMGIGGMALGQNEVDDGAPQSDRVHPGGAGFPVEDPASTKFQEEPAVLGGAAAATAAGGAAYASEDPKSTQDPPEAQPRASEHSSVWPTAGHEEDMPEHGQDEAENTQEDDSEKKGLAAAGAGVGAGALGGAAAYGATHQDEPTPASDQSHQAPTHESAWPTTGLGDELPSRPKQDQHSYDIGYPQRDLPGQDSTEGLHGADERQTHDGRDSALASGGAAAGYGGYEATQSDHEPPRSSQDSPQHKREDHGKLQKSQQQMEKHERELEKARQEQAHKGGDHGEKKHGLLHKIFHPHDKEKHRDDSQRSAASDTKQDSRSSLGSEPRDSHQGRDSDLDRYANQDDGKVVDPHTGLPMNVDKYGSGAGGTDGSQQIEGYHGERI